MNLTTSAGDVGHVKGVLQKLMQAERDLGRFIQSGRNSKRTDVFEAQSFLRQAIASLSKTVPANRT